MNWTNVVDLAELVSAVAALITVGLAFTELVSRSRAKKAAMAMDLYAEFLFVRQQARSAIGAAKSFARNSTTATAEVLASFAKVHEVQPEVFAALERVTKEGVSCFDCFSEKGKEYSTAIMDFTGNIGSLLRQINTYLRAYSAEDTCDAAAIQQACEQLEERYAQVHAQMDTANVILKDNLKKTNRYSEWYLVILFLIIVVLLTINFVL